MDKDIKTEAQSLPAVAGQVELRVRQLEQKVERLDALICAMQSDARTYLTPGSGCGAYWFVGRMLWHLDGPEQRAAQGQPE
jgi:hypothetical protein